MSHAVSVVCAYCGQEVIVTCSKPVVPSDTMISTWICPHTGCARDNVIKCASVVGVARAPKS